MSAAQSAAAVAAQAPPDWLEPALRGEARFPAALRGTGREPVASANTLLVPASTGDDAVGSDDGAAGTPMVIVFRRDQGLLGLIAAPAALAFVGLGGDDSVFWASADGRLWAASSPEAAVAGSFVERTAVPGARGWDAAGALLVAVAARDEIAVSVDGGASFTRRRPVPGREVEQALVRPDGVIVVQTTLAPQRLTVVSTDGGASFRPAELQPRTLRRVGGWIYGCGAVLSRDAQQWTSAADGELLARGWQAARFLTLVEERAGYADYLAMAELAPAPPDSAHRRRGPCARMGSSHRSRPPRVHRDLPALSCRGVECLLRQRCPREPPPTRTRLWLTTSGACPPSAADEWDRCPPTARLTRQPSPILVDEVALSVRALPLPDGCEPVRVRSARGLGVLLCHAEGQPVELYSVDHRGVWQHETTLGAGVDPDTLLAAADGTLLLQEPRPSERGLRAWVRRPLSLGAPGAWRSVTHEQARSYSLGVRGRVVAIVAPPPSVPPEPPVPVTFLLDSTAGTRPLATEVAITGALWHVELTASDELRGWWSDNETASVVARGVTQHGLAPAEPAATAFALPGCDSEASTLPYCWARTCPPRAWRDLRGAFLP